MIRLVTVFLALALTTADARADLTLSQMVGTWTGAGQLRQREIGARLNGGQNEG